MGRHKRRRDSDVDLSVEESYDRKRSHSTAEVPCASTVDISGDIPANNDSDSAVPVAKKANVESEKDLDVDKIEALRRKKQERKERQRLKKAEKMKSAEELKKEQSKLTQKNTAEKKENKSDSGSQTFTTIRKGVQYQDIIVGKGPVVQDRKKVRVAYVLRAKHRFGKILDSSNDFGFRLGRGEVIEGWDLGVQGMRVGGKRYLIVPPQAGYGNQNIGGGPGATLFFEVTVLAC